MPESTVVTAPQEVLTFRKEFPILAHKVHLANNSRSALSRDGMKSVQEYMDAWDQEGAPWAKWAAKHEELRASFADMIGAKMSEIAIVPSVTAAMGGLASCFDWRDRPAVAFDEFSFPSVVYLWLAYQARGVEVRRARSRNGELPPEAFDDILDEKVQLLTVSHVYYNTAHRLNLQAVAEKCRAHDILFVVDDYQCCGTRPIDVQEMGADILMTGTVKYLFGSPGLALLYVREGLFDRLHPAATGWFGQEDFNDFQIERNKEAPDARRFQMGSAAFPAIFDSLAGIELIKSVGLDKIGPWIEALTAHFIDRCTEEGFFVATPRDPAKRGPHVSVSCHDLPAVLGELGKRDIVITGREGNIRAAFHYYNTPEDIEFLIAALKEIEHLIVKAE